MVVQQAIGRMEEERDDRQRSGVNVDGLQYSRQKWEDWLKCPTCTFNSRNFVSRIMTDISTPSLF